MRLPQLPLLESNVVCKRSQDLDLDLELRSFSLPNGQRSNVGVLLLLMINVRLLAYSNALLGSLAELIIRRSFSVFSRDTLAKRLVDSQTVALVVSLGLNVG